MCFKDNPGNQEGEEIITLGSSSYFDGVEEIKNPFQISISVCVPVADFFLLFFAFSHFIASYLVPIYLDFFFPFPHFHLSLFN